MINLELIDLENWGHITAPKDLSDELFIKYRELPVEVFGTLIDCDENSIKTMEQTLKYFDDQPLEAGVFEMRNGEKCVLWQVADNTQQALTKSQLNAVLDETEKQKALRTAKLYAKKRYLKDNAGTYAEALASWL